MEKSYTCIYIMSDQERGFEYMPTYPSNEDDDVYDYIYILTYDLTSDPITMYWWFDRKTKKFGAKSKCQCCVGGCRA